jgi:hypothetical protein
MAWSPALLDTGMAKASVYLSVYLSFWHGLICAVLL